MAVPEIRLKGFKGDLIKCPFSSVAKQYFVSNKRVHHQNLLSLSYGKIKKKDIKSKKGLLPASFDTYQIIKEGIIVFRFTDLQNDKKSLRVGIATEEGIISPAYVCVQCENVLAKYLYLQLYSYDLRKVFYSMGDGLRQTLSYNDVKEMPIFLPSENEQQAIAEYFKSLDSLIQSTTKKIASLKQMKSACLISMFPQEGETKPRVRFKGFEGEWEDISFKEISYLAGTKNKDNLSLESYSISNEFGFIPQNEQFENGGTMSNADKRMYYIVSPDSFAYNPARINVGSIGYDDLDKDVIVSSLYVVFKTDEDTYNPFLNYWFKTPMFKKMIDLYQEGGVRLYFFYDKLCNCHFRRPSNKEQQKIASFFRSLDSQISLLTQRLEKLKQIKSACLDKMFV
ncbi:MAG: restriction endonuclease subunit S [Prevotella sp.]|nr:restriction endonuclease subunit S [Prevotella sp.]